MHLCDAHIRSSEQPSRHAAHDFPTIAIQSEAEQRATRAADRVARKLVYISINRERGGETNLSLSLVFYCILLYRISKRRKAMLCFSLSLPMIYHTTIIAYGVNTQGWCDRCSSLFRLSSSSISISIITTDAPPLWQCACAFGETHKPHPL